ncbi:hypothetical protein LTR15_008043 [Elasticomyces elasticus]|nr:hypothetical protein LTR15_008043 [Elasticomyces elasticus]
MAAPGGQSQWQEDVQRAAWYYVDPRDGARIYHNGVRVPQNPQPSAPRVLARPTPPQVPQRQPQLSTVPTENASGYILGNAARRAGQQSPQSGQRMLMAGMASLQIGAPSTPNFRPRNLQPQPQLPGPTQPTITQENGVQIVVTHEPTSRVFSKVGVGPAQAITDPTLYNEGRRAKGALYGTEGDQEQLFSTFRIRRHNFYIRGRVFRVLWAEPAGEGSADIESFVQNDQDVPNDNSGFTRGRHGQSVYSKARRFVVIREGDYYCSVLPITSYGKQGVGKQGVKKSEHSIIYSHKPVPQPLPSERPERGEAGMRIHAIQVTPDVATEKLDPLLRLDYGKVYTVHHNVKVESYGVVHPNSMDFLLSQWEEVFLDSMRAAHPSLSVSSSNAPATHSRSTDATRTIQQPRVDRPPPNVVASATQLTVSGTPGQSTAQAPLNSSEIARVRQAIQASMQQGRTQAEAVIMLMQRYQAAGHSVQRTTSLIQAACQAPETAASSFRARSSEGLSGARFQGDIGMQDTEATVEIAIPNAASSLLARPTSQDTHEHGSATTLGTPQLSSDKGRSFVGASTRIMVHNLPTATRSDDELEHCSDSEDDDDTDVMTINRLRTRQASPQPYNIPPTDFVVTARHFNEEMRLQMALGIDKSLSLVSLDDHSQIHGERSIDINQSGALARAVADTCGLADVIADSMLIFTESGLILPVDRLFGDRLFADGHVSKHSAWMSNTERLPVRLVDLTDAEEVEVGMASLLSSLQLLVRSGYGNGDLSIIVECTSRVNVAEVVRLKPSDLNQESLKAITHMFGLGLHCLGRDNVQIARAAIRLCALAAVSYAGSHCCDFRQVVWPQSMPQGLAANGTQYFRYESRRLACLEEDIGGPVWMVTCGVDETHLPQALSLTLHDYADLWGPLSVVRSPDNGEKLTAIHSERGMVYRQEKTSFTTANDEVPCHWTRTWLQHRVDVPIGHGLAKGLSTSSQEALPTVPLTFHAASRLLIGHPMAEVETMQAFDLPVDGLVEHAPFLGSQHVTPRHRSDRTVFQNIGFATNDHCGLTLDALKNSRYLHLGKMDTSKAVLVPDSYTFGINGGAHVNVVGTTTLKYTPAKTQKSCLINRLKDTGVDREGNLRVWWPFGGDAQYARLPGKAAYWLNIVRDHAASATFAVFDQQCWEYRSGRQHRKDVPVIRGCQSFAWEGHGNAWRGPEQPVLKTTMTVKAPVLTTGACRLYCLHKTLGVVRKDRLSLSNGDELEFRNEERRGQLALYICSARGNLKVRDHVGKMFGYLEHQPAANELQDEQVDPKYHIPVHIL